MKINLVSSIGLKSILFAGLLLAMPWATWAQKKSEVPVIIIMADQLRYDVMGEHTPNINALAENGVVFHRAYSSNPLCAPSRASFFTGLYPNRSGSLINGWVDRDKAFSKVKSGTPNLYDLLGDKWDSRHIGKQHFFTEDNISEHPANPTRWITHQGFNKWITQQGKTKAGGTAFTGQVPEMISGETTHFRRYSLPVTDVYVEGLEYFIDHYISTKSIEAIRNRRSDRPLLLNAMFMAPHPPFHIPEPYFSKFSLPDTALPDNVGKWYQGQSPLQMYNITGFFGTRYSREEWHKVWEKYMGLVSLLDDEVGRLLDALKEEGLYDKALIIFTSDHGEMLGSHSLWQKMCMYEESVRVPLYIKFPKSHVPAIKSSRELVSLVDVLPTILEYVQVPVPDNIDGKSLLPHIHQEEPHRNSIFIQYDGNGSLGNFQRSVLQGDYKLIVDMFKDEIFLELYDVVEDPMETRNLVFDEKHQAKSTELINLLHKYMKDTGDRLTLQDGIYPTFIQQYKGITK